MPIDVTQPPDNQQFPTFPAALRAILTQINNSYAVVPIQFEKAGVLAVAMDVSPQKLIQIDLNEPPVILAIVAHVKTAPATQPVIVDVNKNGVSVFTNQANRPTIAVGQNLSAEMLPDVTALGQNDVLTIDIDQVGVGPAGSDLVVAIRTKVGTVYA